jgi:uncharacterized protein YfaP (DUF2135 family)
MSNHYTRRAGLLALTLLSLAGPTLLLGCKDDKEEAPPQLAGTPGNPRFNLQFTNDEDVDLDLYVKTPSGAVIYYGNREDEGGELDVDCRCSACPNGPNENIFWVPGTAPSGTYQFYVKYYSSCGGANNPSSDFTLRVVNNNTILKTYTGTLNENTTQSQMYTYTY